MLSVTIPNISPSQNTPVLPNMRRIVTRPSGASCSRRNSAKLSLATILRPPSGSKPAIERGITLGRPLPTDLTRHGATLHLPPRGRLREQVEGAGKNQAKGTGGWWRKLKPRGNAVVQRRLAGVDHRVGEPANARHDRQCSIALCIELREATGFESRRHDDGVCTGLKEVRQPLVIIKDAGDAAWSRRRRRAKLCLKPGLAGSQQSQLASSRQQIRQCGQREIQALLVRKSTHD